MGIDPRNGAIRILLSSPSFDPNNYDRKLNIDPDSPLLNRALHGRYPPGSTFKLAVAGLAVERGISEQIYCPANGYFAPGARRPIRDHEYYSFERRGLAWPGFGSLDLDTALSGAATALGNVGPGIGEVIGPSGNFKSLPDGAKWLLSLGKPDERFKLVAGGRNPDAADRHAGP